MARDPLAALVRDVRHGGMPLLAWCVEFARDGDPLPELWARCVDSWTMWDVAAWFLPPLSIVPFCDTDAQGSGPRCRDYARRAAGCDACAARIRAQVPTLTVEMVRDRCRRG